MTIVEHVWLQDFRNYGALDISLTPGRTVIVGQNGQGKSNLIEAIAYLGSLRSFRGAPTEALIARHADTAVVRAQAMTGDRELLVEAELARSKPNRIQVNKQRLGRSRDLLGLVPVTVFGPDDLELVKSGPSLRRGYLDELLVQLHPRNAKAKADLDRVLKQRNTLLKQARGRLSDEIETTLNVWDTKLHELGTVWGDARAELVEQLEPLVTNAYNTLASDPAARLRYAPPWREQGLGQALLEARDDEVRRGVTLVGPHRDELEIVLAEMPARTHASQGEQRTLALSLRIAGHQQLTEGRGTTPILLLDDVFSELDHERSTALLDLLVAEQTLITTASDVPSGVGSVTTITIANGARMGEPVISL